MNLTCKIAAFLIGAALVAGVSVAPASAVAFAESAEVYSPLSFPIVPENIEQIVRTNAAVDGRRILTVRPAACLLKAGAATLRLLVTGAPTAVFLRRQYVATSVVTRDGRDIAMVRVVSPAELKRLHCKT
jgi:hypothetical protein